MRVLLVYPNATRNHRWGYLGPSRSRSRWSTSGGARLDGHDVRLWTCACTTRTGGNATRLSARGGGVHGLLDARAPQPRGLSDRPGLVPGCQTVAGGHHATLERWTSRAADGPRVVAKGAAVPAACPAGEGRARAGITGTCSRVDGESFRGRAERLRHRHHPVPYRTLVPETVPATSSLDEAHRAAAHHGDAPTGTFCALWRIMDGRYTSATRHGGRGAEDDPERYVFFVDYEPFVDSKRMCTCGGHPGRGIEGVSLQPHRIPAARPGPDEALHSSVSGPLFGVEPSSTGI